MADHAVVIAFFNEEASAEAAATSLKDSGMANGDDVGVLDLDEDGNLRAEQVGKRSWGKGAGIGAVVALVTPVGLAAGLIGGGLLGALHHKRLGLDEADRERISNELQRGERRSAYPGMSGLAKVLIGHGHIDWPLDPSARQWVRDCRLAIK